MPQSSARPADVMQAPATVTFSGSPEQLRLLQDRRDVIAEQYQVTMAERGRISQERLNAAARGDAGMVKEYDATIERLGARLRTLEASLQKADQELDAALKAPVSLSGEAAPPPAVFTELAPPPMDWETVFIKQRTFTNNVIGFGGTGLLLLALLAWRFGLAKGKRLAMEERARQSVATRDDERLQQAIDAIAIEVERLSEGQRFLNNLMATRKEPGAMLPVPPRVITPTDGTRITPH